MLAPELIARKEIDMNYRRTRGWTYGNMTSRDYKPVYYHDFKLWPFNAFVTMSVYYVTLNISLFGWNILSTAWSRQK